jgi:hypothetical protein
MTELELTILDTKETIKGSIYYIFVHAICALNDGYCITIDTGNHCAFFSNVNSFKKAFHHE